jgi:hypothetical protein
MQNLKQWLNCLLGRHLWIDYAAVDGDLWTFCLHCGESFD